MSNQTANSTTGKMGYKVLDPTKTFASQVTAENTIYEIRDVFDLGSTQETPVSVTIPDGCTLKFNGGVIKNCTLVNAYIDAAREKIFDTSVNFINLKNGVVYPEWWGAVADGKTDNSSSVQKALSISKTVSFGRGTYVCNTALQCSSSASIVGENKQVSIIKTNGITLNRSMKVNNISLRAINKSTPYILKITNAVNPNNEYTENIVISDIFIYGGGYYDTTDNQIKAIVIECCITNNTSGMYNSTFENIMIDGKVDYGIYFNSVDNTSGNYSWITYFYFRNIFINSAKYPIEFVSNSEWNQYNFQAIYFENVTAQYNANYTESFVKLSHISHGAFSRCHCVDNPGTFTDYYVKDNYCSVNISCYPASFSNMISSFNQGYSVEQNLADFTYGVIADVKGPKMGCRILSSTKIANGAAPEVPYITPMCFLDTENTGSTSFVGLRFTNYKQLGNTRYDFLLGVHGGTPVFSYSTLDGSKWQLRRLYSTHTIPVYTSSSFPSTSTCDRGGFVFYTPLNHLICYDSYAGRWYDSLGVRITSNVTKRRGSTSDRTGMTMYSYNDGFLFYDTDLKKYVLWNGSAWVNMDGTALS